MTFAMKQDEPSDPLDVGFFRTYAIVLCADDVTYLHKQPGTANLRERTVSLEPEEIKNLRRGVHHFRAGDYFATHDDWEAVWQGLRGRPRTFWQAMIQLVVGAYHYQNGNRKGCDSLWRKALQKCEDLTPTYDDIPEPLTMLTELLQTCLVALHQDDDPLPHITHFAHAVLSDAWFAFR